MALKIKNCEHIESISVLKYAKEYECEECVKSGGIWVHLRTCQDCGTTLCCDSSPNKHASLHAKNHGHNVVNSAEPGERWLWCYLDKKIAKY